MLECKIYTASCVGNSSNCLYPDEIKVCDRDSFNKAISFDHVTAQFTNSYRSKDNFISSTCIPMDCDNDHSDVGKDWVTPFDVALAFPNVCFYASYSRNHMKDKHGKCARPRFHVYFPIEEVSDAKAYVELKTRIQSVFPYFDSNALDAARFLYGVKTPLVELYDGEKTITDFLSEEDFSEFDAGTEEIPSGQRNSRLSHIAGKLIKRYGATDETHEKFLREAERCNPPLPDAELSKIWYSAKKFGLKVASQEGYIPPSEYGKSYEEYKPDDLTDIAMAEVFAKHNKNKAVYTMSAGWLYWTGKKWEASELKVMKLYMLIAKKVLKNAGIEFKTAYEEFVQAESSGDKEQADKAKSEVNRAKQYLSFAKKMNDHSKVSGILKLAKSMLEVANEELDRDAFILNTPCGIVDLKTGMLKAHDPCLYCTKMTAVCPSQENMGLWQTTLDMVTAGDKEFQTFLQSHAGSTLIGQVFEESLLLVYGSGGNGKSTVFNAEAHVLGDYAGKIPAESLTTRAKNVKVDLAELCGKRFILASETEEGQRLSISMLKQIASVDDISAERKYYAPFTFTPSHSTILYTNHLPKVGSNDKGTWRRIFVAPFTKEIKNPKTDYVDELLQKAGGAILQWMIEGAKIYIQNSYKFPICKVVEQAKDAYRAENDWIGHFITDYCIKGVNETEMSRSLYLSYRQWANLNGEYVRNDRDFSKALLLAGYSKKRTGKGYQWCGLSINPNLQAQEDFL